MHEGQVLLFWTSVVVVVVIIVINLDIKLAKHSS